MANDQDMKRYRGCSNAVICIPNINTWLTSLFHCMFHLYPYKDSPPHPHEEWIVKTSTLVCWPEQEQIYICWKFNADSSAWTHHFNNWNAINSMHNIYEETYFFTKYQEADKSLARPGRKQARKHVRDVHDFNNMETQAVIKNFFFFLQGKAPKEIHAILTETLACFLPGRTKDLSALL